MSLEKLRVLVFSIFLIALMIFGVAYKPNDAMSHPAGNGTTVATEGAVPHR